MGEDRMNALLLLFIHKDIPLDYGSIVAKYARCNTRRMNFINPCSEWSVKNDSPPCGQIHVTTLIV